MELKNHPLPTLHCTYGMLMRGCMIACDHLASAGKNEIQTALDKLSKKTLTQQVKGKAAKKDESKISRVGIFSKSIWEKQQDNSCSPRQQAPAKLKPHSSGQIKISLKHLGNRVFLCVTLHCKYQRHVQTLWKNWYTKEKIGILHGKAAYFIYRQFADREYKRQDIDEKYQTKYQTLIAEGHEPESAKTLIVQEQAKKHAKVWKRPDQENMPSLTKCWPPFNSLKAFFGIRGFEMQMAEMSQGLFIFDEIHAYDPHTTALILTMIKKLREDYNAKFCIMTATMPQFLKQMINEVQLRQPCTDWNGSLKNGTKNSLGTEIQLLDGNIHDALPKIEDRPPTKDSGVIGCL